MTDYDELVQRYGYVESQVGVNEDGEAVIVTIDETNACLRTMQKNGWMRINIYYPDGMSEESYTK